MGFEFVLVLARLTEIFYASRYLFALGFLKAETILLMGDELWKENFLALSGLWKIGSRLGISGWAAFLPARSALT